MVKGYALKADLWREDLSGPFPSLRLRVTLLEWCPGCHPERSEGSLRPSSQTQSSRSEPALAEALERSEGVTGMISTCLP